MGWGGGLQIGTWGFDWEQVHGEHNADPQKMQHKENKKTQVRNAGFFKVKSIQKSTGREEQKKNTKKTKICQTKKHKKN